MQFLKFVLFFLVAITAMVVRAEEACSSIFEGSVEVQKDHLAYQTLRELLVKIEADQNSITLCVDESQTDSRFYVIKRRRTICLSGFVLKSFSHRLLKAGLAHEIGHIFGEQNGKTREENEILADAYALKLVEPRAFLELYLAHTNDPALAKRRLGRALKLLSK